MMARSETDGREATSHVEMLRLPSDQDASGRSLGAEEIERLHAVIASGVLTATKGAQTRELEVRVATLTGRRHALACSSGTAAVHTAIAALDLEPGDEVITTSITDMGALTPILYQGAIPKFADADPATGMVTAATVAAAQTDRTRAVVVTHLFGAAAEVDTIATALPSGLPLVEDCAQAFLTRRAGRLVGTFGVGACFSTQQGKHITTGEGGLVTSDDDAFARRARVFVNKAWPYGEADPDHEFLALNYRTTELQSAVANAQLEKLVAGVAQRQSTVARFAAALSDVPGVTFPAVAPGDEATWWKVALLVDPDLVPGGPRAVATALATRGVATAPRYIQKPAFACRVFREQRTFGTSRWPFTLARPDALDYSPERFPGTYTYLDRVLVVPWNERYEPAHADAVAAAIADVVEELRRA
ncbi:MAG: DegT/DnrJ/EryC1/StrS family aminotransferase [Acidimicrobiia bacterium]